MRQVSRSSKRSASLMKELPRKARLDWSSRPHVIRSDRQASSLRPTCCRRNSLTDKVMPTCVVAPDGEGSMKNPEPAPCHKRPQGPRSTVILSWVGCSARRSDACGYGKTEALASRLRHHRQRECCVTQRHFPRRVGAFC